ncbi:TylF/MycF/NovP-related O-methyltransferase [Thiocystis violacea]|uniref:TylF/MycF/NovP-related O-methyltransferase n=1 Tax=Thiocystis violacea TaxID=13725 RepID=UPI001906D4DB|nr:TylF/MycF/NovP-related O-methyltransferase [Thiocystis violacea]
MMLDQERDRFLKLLDQAREALTHKDFASALQRAADIKATRLPIKGTDQVRGKAFLGLGATQAAIEAFREELRCFPENPKLRKQLAQLTAWRSHPSSHADECDALIWRVREYTMLSPERLRSLYTLVKRICQEDRPGCFVECGVAAGGSSALIAWVINRYSKRLRQLFCFDTFEGMPDPGVEDRMAGNISASQSGWGAGTCRAPVESLDAICNTLGVFPIVRPVQGLFRDTLPKWRETLGEIAFLHMDGDWYESTHDILSNLYEQISPHGYIQIDDYGHWSGCRKAVHEFAAQRRLKFDFHDIDATGVWLEKIPWNPSEKRLLNLGCGNRYHGDWINVDFTSSSDQVISYNLLQGIPFEKASFDVVYHSHILEHFPKSQAPSFLLECYRVLKRGGILRIAVPDLEAIARDYLRWLELSLEGDPDAQRNYDWIVLEMFDQMVRNRSGGEMLRYWRLNPMPAEDYVIQRMGSEVKQVISYIRVSATGYPVQNDQALKDPEQIGRFRLSGEIHQWMYDRYSLSKLLQDTGFEHISVCRADQSAIPYFNEYLLDIEADGSARKPDSLFMEAQKH